MKVEVSNGELLDKLSILEVKKEKIKKKEKLLHVEREHAHLKSLAGSLEFSLEDSSYVRLREINYQLWDIEDEIRKKEEENDFGKRFIELSRSIYILNDERFRMKNDINKRTNSLFQEQKDHKNT
mgnify:CR=1 FL=1|tara:strand:- start:3175 stop:3549 length:375 start_codon:yes stop_codon:yes gene_type:complete